jgi:small subunit ribosomal protein S20
MPNTPSAKKRLRQDEKKRVRNQAIKTRVKTETKKVLAGGEIVTAFAAIDRAAAKGRHSQKRRRAQEKPPAQKSDGCRQRVIF